MAITTLNRPGSDNGGANVAANLLKIFAGEVITSFRDSNLALGLTTIKNVSGGAISHTFPVSGGIPNAQYHAVGADILRDNNVGGAGSPPAGPYLKQIRTAQRIVHMDKALVLPIFIDKLDQELAHWDVRRYWSAELGVTLGRTVDTNILRMIFTMGAAGGGASVTGSPSGFLGGGTFGSTKINVGAIEEVALTSSQVVNALFDMKVAMDRKFVPKQGRVAVMPPEIMKRFFFKGDGTVETALNWINRDFSGLPVSNGSYREGMVPMLAGFILLESNNMDYFGATTFGAAQVPDAQFYGPYDISSVYGPNTTGVGLNDNLYEATLSQTQVNNDYSAEYSATNKPYILCWQKSAIATVKLEDLSIQSEYMIEFQGDVIVARMVLGHGILRPECVGVIGKFS